MSEYQIADDDLAKKTAFAIVGIKLRRAFEQNKEQPGYYHAADQQLNADVAAFAKAGRPDEHIVIVRPGHNSWRHFIDVRVDTPAFVANEQGGTDFEIRTVQYFAGRGALMWADCSFVVGDHYRIMSETLAHAVAVPLASVVELQALTT